MTEADLWVQWWAFPWRKTHPDWRNVEAVVSEVALSIELSACTASFRPSNFIGMPSQEGSMTCVAGPRQTVPRRAADMVFEKVGASPGQATQVSAQKGAIKKIKFLKNNHIQAIH
ncbi:hypothetical protein [Pseudomonas sp. ML2-2023-3]|uniref:hypothetical protein n=1 Tax=Pseudomonas sp. ML2-2023-3 TaxID=3122375 RepID=UPI0030CAEADC